MAQKDTQEQQEQQEQQVLEEPTELDLRTLKADFAVSIEEIMTKECSKYECVICDEHDIGTLWTFIIEDSISGFIGVEDNEEGIGIPTVTAGIHLKEITDYDREAIMELFELNSELINATFTVATINEKVEKEQEPVFAEEGESIEYEDQEEETTTREILLIQCKVPLAAFDPNDFPSLVQNLMIQSDMALGESSEESQESES